MHADIVNESKITYESVFVLSDESNAGEYFIAQYHPLRIKIQEASCSCFLQLNCVNYHKQLNNQLLPHLFICFLGKFYPQHPNTIGNS